MGYATEIKQSAYELGSLMSANIEEASSHLASAINAHSDQCGLVDVFQPECVTLAMRRDYYMGIVLGNYAVKLFASTVEQVASKLE